VTILPAMHSTELSSSSNATKTVPDLKLLPHLPIKDSMNNSSNLKSAWAQCTEGHKIRLEIRVESEERLQPVPCPTCETKTMVFAGDVLGVLPGDWFFSSWRSHHSF